MGTAAKVVELGLLDGSIVIHDVQETFELLHILYFYSFKIFNTIPFVDETDL